MSIAVGIERGGAEVCAQSILLTEGRSACVYVQSLTEQPARGRDTPNRGAGRELSAAGCNTRTDPSCELRPDKCTVHTVFVW